MAKPKDSTSKGDSLKRGPKSTGASGVSAGNATSPVEDVTRSMPRNEDAERAILSCMLQDPANTIPRAIESLNSGFFYIPAYRTIFEAMLHLYKTNQQGNFDLVVLITELGNRGQLDAVGGPKSLADLLDDVPTTALFEEYIRFLKEKFILRRVIQDCTECISDAYLRPEDVAGFLDSVEKRMLQIRNETERTKGIEDIRTHVMAVIDSAQKMYGGEGGSGLNTGFDDLDKMTTGFHGGEMIVIAARPSMGKTSFVMNIVENLAVPKDKRVPCAVFSLEMTAQSLVQRLLCSRAKIDMNKLRSGFLSKTDMHAMMRVAGDLAEASIFIDDTPGLSINELQAKARRLKQQHDIQLIAIDYLQLLRAPDVGNRDGREKEIAAISGGIKGIAKELNIPVVVLAQLNRNPDSRGGGKPRMSDLRESGSIEQDADLIGLLIREEIYAEDDKKDELKGKAELIIAKQRNGPTGEVPLTFHKELMRFESRAHQQD